MVHEVIDVPLLSMGKYTDEPTVWSDGPWYKYDPVSTIKQLSAVADPGADIIEKMYFLWNVFALHCSMVTNVLHAKTRKAIAVASISTVTTRIAMSSR